MSSTSIGLDLIRPHLIRTSIGPLESEGERPKTNKAALKLFKYYLQKIHLFLISAPSSHIAELTFSQSAILIWWASCSTIRLSLLAFLQSFPSILSYSPSSLSHSSATYLETIGRETFQAFRLPAWGTYNTCLGSRNPQRRLCTSKIFTPSGNLTNIKRTSFEPCKQLSECTSIADSLTPI